ncbi:protein YLS7-like, partial [Camellia sinensis]|uniref:protein YLS7-like n=1 Tax=Camellia sinensis TaxID=4442 RepID=UPI001035DF6E
KSVDQQGQEAKENPTSSNVAKGVENAEPASLGLVNSSNIIQPGLAVPSSSPASGDISKSGSVDSGCDLYHGKWVHDSTGPLYTNDSCPVLTQTQNCQGNGRPDKDYENWRWQPDKCDLPRFDSKKFLELMRGKTLAFIGDSLARNQMESLLCILWQASIKTFYSDITIRKECCSKLVFASLIRWPMPQPYPERIFSVYSTICICELQNFLSGNLFIRFLEIFVFLRGKSFTYSLPILDLQVGQYCKRFTGLLIPVLIIGLQGVSLGEILSILKMGISICYFMILRFFQIEVPKYRGNRRMHHYYFRSTSTMIVRKWSAWLVHTTPEPFDFIPKGVDKLHLDAPDERFMEFIPNFDVIVLSSGHWFGKQSVYILNNEIVGGQFRWPDKKCPTKVNHIEAFGISVETILTALATHPNYTGLTIVRSFSPHHYERGEWNTGGSCTGKVKPALDSELVENGYTNIMHEKPVAGFECAIKKMTNKSKLKFMDITGVFAYRHDGHPGPYRSTDPNKITKRGPNGMPPPQDCLHWCMPGPVDTWNELMLEIISREFEGNQSLRS